MKEKDVGRKDHVFTDVTTQRVQLGSLWYPEIFHSQRLPEEPRAKRFPSLEEPTAM